MKNLIKSGSIFLILLIVSFDSILLGCAGSGQKLNVLFIAVDDLRPTLGCYGDSIAITPHTDHLASQGIVFNHAYCQQAVCNPSRASVMTGLRPDQIGVTNLVSHFRTKFPDIKTLPQIFRNNGYDAVAVGKIFHGAKSTQDEVSWSKPSLLNLSIKQNEYVLPQNKTGKKASSVEFADEPDEKYEDGMIAQRAIDQLKEFKKSGKPFFLGVGFKKPHLPFCAPQKYWDLYKSNQFDSIPDRQRPVNAPEIAFHNSQELRGYSDIPELGTINPDQEKTLWQAYYACVSFIDAQLGKIIEQLTELGLAENTIVVLWGDHGYHLGEQELWCKSTNFELDTQIPFIFSVPGENVLKGAKLDALVEAVDIYPTLLDLCNLEKPGELAGSSLKPLFEDPSAEGKEYAFSQFVRPYSAVNRKTYSHMGYSVRNRDWRCTVWYKSGTDSVEFRELYNLKEYRIEKKNYSGNLQYAELEAKLTHLLHDYKNGKY